LARVEELRRKALSTLQEFEVLMIDGHFDYGNGYHGRVYLNAHRIFRQPSLIWRLSQDLLDVIPGAVLDATDVVAGPITGGALLAHTLAGLLDSRRHLGHEPTSFAPLSFDDHGDLSLRHFYRSVVRGRRVLLADDVRNTGKTFETAKSIIESAGGTVVATTQIYDRMEAMVDLGVPNYPLVEYRAPENYPFGQCPMCKAGELITSF